MRANRLVRLFLALGIGVSWVALLCGCVRPTAAPPVLRVKTEAIQSPPPRIFTLDTPRVSGVVEEPRVTAWRARHEAWTSGTLSQYPFLPQGAPERLFDPTPVGEIDALGQVVTEPAVRIPRTSVHQTDPWGERGCVWPVQERWSPLWERRYSQWVASSVDENFLLDNQVAADCSDFPYVIRWIFARTHYLPQGGHNATGAIFGNWNTRFADLPTALNWREDQRFRAALEYVLREYIQGRSIPYDTYPIDARHEARMLRPGTLVADKRHMRLIHTINPDSHRPIRHLSATLPSKIRKLADEALSGATPNDGPGWAIVNWSWWDYDFAFHRYFCVPDRKMPGFSLHQYSRYDSEITAGWLHLQYEGRASQAHIDSARLLDDMLADLTESIAVRQDVIAEGWAYYADRPSDRDKTTQAYDDFSTHQRDARIRRLVEEVEQVIYGAGLPTTVVNSKMDEVEIAIADERTITLKVLGMRLKAKTLSSEPWDPPWRRWGESPDQLSVSSE